MGKHKKKHQLVGYGYYFSFVYGFCERIENWTGYKMNGQFLWQGSTSSGFAVPVPTGKKGDVYKSPGSAHTYVNVYFGLPTDNPTGIKSGMKYKNTTIAVFNDAFVGDNTTNIPDYEFRFERYNVGGSLPYQKIGYGVNPAAIIYDILVNQLEVDSSRIDMTSFNNAANVMHNEGLGMAFVLTRAKKGLEWIKEILRYMDAAMYFDYVTGKYVLKVFRGDYDTSSIPVLDNSSISDLKITRSGWTDVVSTFIFKYSDTHAGEEHTYIVNNPAAREANGFESTQTFDYTLVYGFDAMQPIIERAIKKFGAPGAKAKFKVNFVVGSTLRPGDVFLLENPVTKLQEVYRVTKLGGDKVENPYYDVEAISDVYGRGFSFLPPATPPSNSEVAHWEIQEPLNAYISKMPHEYLLDDTMQYKPFLVIGAPRDNSEYVEVIQKQSASFEYEFNSPTFPWKSGKIVGASKNGMQKLAEIGYHPDFQIKLWNDKGIFTRSYHCSPEEFQKGTIILASPKDDYPLFYARDLDLYKPDPDSWSGSYVIITGLLDPYAGPVDTWYTGPVDTIHSIYWGSNYENQVYVRINRPVDDSELYYIQGHSPYCENSSNPKRLIQHRFANTFYATDWVDNYPNDCFYMHKAAGAENLTIELNTAGTKYLIKWTPVDLVEGVARQDADSYVGADVEGSVFGQYAIEKVSSSGSVQSVYDNININFVSASNNGYIVYELDKTVGDSQMYWAVYHWSDVLGGSTSDGSYLNNGTKRVYFTLPIT